MRFSLPKIILLPLLLVLYVVHASFCGFYVAKADAAIFNKSSQVIIARSGEQTAITMGSDFRGDVKDFAMIVPVPTVIKKDQIRIAKQEIFDKLDAYTGPRLVEYQDENPCAPRMIEVTAMSSAPARGGRPSMARAESARDDYHVTILESYSVGEYDILVLSAEESGGLQRWLTDNGYKIPEGAADVLEPYIKTNMKFFVVKVNLEEYKKQQSGATSADGFVKLRPIQMTFKSPKFMLPIRLGMANANGDQDLIVYSFTDDGRTECANYRTVNIPTDREIPEYTKDVFGEFYKRLFDKAWARENKNVVMLEYGWDISSSNYSHCDPCTTTPPTYVELREAGVFWATNGNNGSYSTSDYQGNVYVTRLHVRYNRKTFPQDLLFQATPNKATFQGRYVMRHPAQGDLTCGEGKKYLRTLVNRRKKEVEEFYALTDWTPGGNTDYISRFEKMLPANERNNGDGFLGPLDGGNDKDAAPLLIPGNDGTHGGEQGQPLSWGWYMLLAMSLLGAMLLMALRAWRLRVQ